MAQTAQKRIFKVGEEVTCINSAPLLNNDIAPPLKVGQKYKIQEICLDKEGNQHLHVGLKSDLNFVRSFETKENLPEGDKKHWCHPSRFE